MKQQINLYSDELKPRKIIFPASQMLLLLGFVVLAFVAAWFIQEQAVKPLRSAAADTAQQLKLSEQAVLDAKQNYPLPVADKALSNELTKQRKRLNKTRAIAHNMKSGAYGSVDGLSPYLEGLARQHVAGTWLTGVLIQRGGRALALRGKSLVPELVPTYLDRLSDEAVLKGKTFSKLDMNSGGDLNEITFSVSTQGVVSGDDS